MNHTFSRPSCFHFLSALTCLVFFSTSIFFGVEIPVISAESDLTPSAATSSKTDFQARPVMAKSGGIAAYLSSAEPLLSKGVNPLNPITDSQSKSGWLAPLDVENNRFTLVEGRSHFMKFSTRLSRISVSNPSIVDFVTLTSTEVLLNAKTNGSVDLIVWDTKNAMASFEINVIKDPGLLDQLLKNIDPKGKFEIYPSKNVFVVRGSTSTVQKQKSIDDAVKSFAPGSISLVKIFAIRQILLQCRFVQVDHGRDHSFGLDAEMTAANKRNSYLQRFLPGGSHGANAEVSEDGTFTTEYMDLKGLLANNDNDTYQLVTGSHNINVNMFIKALETEQIAKTIARPNLLAKDGEEASFIVGGETAYALSTNNEISVQYKEFGTKLKFKPEIMDDDTISLSIEPEVSEINDALGVDISGYKVPGISRTQVKTMVQLKDGETLILGGMIQQKMSTDDNGIPGLRRMPFFGKLFQSSAKTWQETELIIIVTPKIVQPDKEGMRQKGSTDVLIQATDLLKPDLPVVDDHANAIKYYLEENKRWASRDEVKEAVSYVSPKQIEEKLAAEKLAAEKKLLEQKKADAAKLAATQSAIVPIASKPRTSITVQPMPLKTSNTQTVKSLQTSADPVAVKSSGYFVFSKAYSTPGSTNASAASSASSVQTPSTQSGSQKS